MSKAENMFKVVDKRRGDELQNGLMNAAKYVTSNCELCPLKDKPQCVLETMPPAASPERDDHICKDWLFLHFINEQPK